MMTMQRWSPQPSAGKHTPLQLQRLSSIRQKKQNPKLNFEPKMTLTVFDLAIGLQKNQPELKEKLNEWIETNIKNGKLNAIYEKYHGEPIPQEILNR